MNRLVAWGMEPDPVQTTGWGRTLEDRAEDGHRFNVFTMRDG